MDSASTQHQKDSYIHFRRLLLRKEAGQPFKKCIQRMLSNGHNFGGQGSVTTFDYHPIFQPKGSNYKAV